MEKEILMPQAVWEGLKGKKVILAGNECELRRRFQENLIHIAGIHGNSFQVVPGMDETDSGRYVFLFAHPEKMEQLQELLGQLQELARVKPEAAVLISDNRVYGKLFGRSHPLETWEIGYACHTRAEDIPVTNLRTAEHFACRLAREEGLDIRVARGDASPSGDILVEMTETAVRILLEGEAGAVYNLPMRKPDDQEGHSPLAPIPIVTATGK